MADWLLDNQAFLWSMAALSVAMFVGTLLLLPLLIVRMPADYFVRKSAPDECGRVKHYLLRLVLLALKNAVGLLFLITGIVLLAFPGQGLLTILIGITLLNFPGKRRLELWFVSRPAVLRAINWIRTRANRAPLLLPPANRPAATITLDCPAEPTSEGNACNEPEPPARSG